MGVAVLAIDADPAGHAARRRAAAEADVVAEQVEADANRFVVVDPEHGGRGTEREMQGNQRINLVSKQAMHHEPANLRHLRGQFRKRLRKVAVGREPGICAVDCQVQQERRLARGRQHQARDSRGDMQIGLVPTAEGGLFVGHQDLHAANGLGVAVVANGHGDPRGARQTSRYRCAQSAVGEPGRVDRLGADPAGVRWNRQGKGCTFGLALGIGFAALRLAVGQIVPERVDVRVNHVRVGAHVEPCVEPCIGVPQLVRPMQHEMLKRLHGGEAHVLIVREIVGCVELGRDQCERSAIGSIEHRPLRRELQLRCSVGLHQFDETWPCALHCIPRTYGLCL